MSKTKTTEEFILDSQKIHNQGYNYDLVDYKNNLEKVKIVCFKHGVFYQSPSGHLAGKGCAVCAKERASILLKSSNDEFILKARLVHGDKYTYIETYKNAKTKIAMRCNQEHPVFYQNPNSHLNGQGCPVCGQKLIDDSKTKSHEKFLTEARCVHGDKFIYIGNYQKGVIKIGIRCDKGHIFYQTPASHLKGAGCPRCSPNISKPATEWLDTLGVVTREIRIPGTKYTADGYDKATNTVYEFHGSYWHGDPTKYPPDKMNKTCNMTHGELYRLTIEKETIIRSLGYKLVVLWESEWDKMKKSKKTR